MKCKLWLRRAAAAGLRCITGTLGILVSLAVLCMIAVPLVLVAASVLPKLTYTLLILAGAWILAPVLVKWSKRRLFMRKLRGFCRGVGCRLCFTGHPLWNAFFRVQAGGRMEYPDRTVELYFVPCLLRGARLCLQEDGVAIYHHRLRLRDVTLVSWEHRWRFCPMPKEGSYLLLMPAPNEVYAREIRPAATEADNGTRVGNYTVFTGGAFLRHAARTPALCHRTL